MAIAAPNALQPGSRLGKYELARFLGEGGFAEVWLGRHVEDLTRRDVAIKVMRRGRSASPADRAMFLDEANIAAGICHPNVARVYEVNEEQGVPYLVMEHVSGPSLESIARGAKAMRQDVPVAIAGALMAGVAAGLHAAHELKQDGRPQHVVHRDVSPQNILITEDGVPKVIDFGIAKARERISRETSTGIAKGKIAYMSPEQARGAELDRRADIWAVGVVLFELVEGRKVLAGPNEIARLQLLVSRPIRPTFRRAPPKVAAVIERALSFRARDRQETADELRIELEEALAAEGLGANQAEIARYCIEARGAAERATPTPRGTEARDLLGGGTAPATVSVIDASARPRARARFVATVALAATLMAVTGGLAIRYAVRGHAGGPRATTAAVTAKAASPVLSIDPVAQAGERPEPPLPPSGVIELEPAPEAAKLPERRTARPAAPAVKAPAKAKRARRPADYAQIE